MGAAFCFVELTSAFPYFGFIAVLAQYRLAFPCVLLFILIYNFIYILPLILLYFGYNRLQGTKAIKKLESLLGTVSSYLLPAVMALAGALLCFAFSAFLAVSFEGAAAAVPFLGVFLLAIVATSGKTRSNMVKP